MATVNREILEINEPNCNITVVFNTERIDDTVQCKISVIKFNGVEFPNDGVLITQWVYKIPENVNDNFKCELVDNNIVYTVKHEPSKVIISAITDIDKFLVLSNVDGNQSATLFLYQEGNSVDIIISTPDSEWKKIYGWGLNCHIDKEFDMNDDSVDLELIEYYVEGLMDRALCFPNTISIDNHVNHKKQQEILHDCLDEIFSSSKPWGEEL